MKVLVRIVLGVGIALLVLAGIGAGLVALRYGGSGEGSFPDRSGKPLYPATLLEEVASLELPPGNLAVSRGGRLFFTFHPEARPPVQVAEWVDGQAVPYPSVAFQPGGTEPLRFQSVLSVRIDRQERLWALDNAHHGIGQPRLLAFDLRTGDLVHHYDFPREIAGLGSHLNDFQVDPLGAHAYIADASIFAQRPALVVYDITKREARRLLEGHESVQAEPYLPVVQGRRMLVFGIFAIRPGVDSIALDRRGQWLYFASVTARKLFRARADDLKDATLSAQALAQRVEPFADKTMSDGITTDLGGNVYLTALEHDAIALIQPNGSLHTLIRDERLRWPDGFSFGPDGLYVACSALHHVIGRTPGHIRAHAPYSIFRAKLPGKGIPGH